MTKRTLSDLAILGGTPAFEAQLHVGRPNLGDRARLLERINDALDRRWLTNRGHYVQEFERRIAAFVGARHCIATCNGAVGLEIGIRALALTGEVLVPAFTFVATPHALEWQGITPVFVDVDPRTHLIDPESVRRAITPRTTGILGVHLWGQVCDVHALQTIAEEHGLALVFDAAHALGCASPQGTVGTFGALEVFSFHATKFVNSLEGGAVVTNDDELARKVRLMKNFGFLGFDNVGYVGTNGKMNEFSAAMGLTSLESIEAFVAANRRNHAQYAARLQGLPGVHLLAYDAADRQNYQYVVAEIAPDCAIGRDRLLDVLWAENVLARRYFYPGCHRMEPYRSQRGLSAAPLPMTERVSARVLVLPSGQTLSASEIDRVCDVIHFAVSNGEAVSERLAGTSAVHQDVFAH